MNLELLILSALRDVAPRKMGDLTLNKEVELSTPETVGAQAFTMTMKKLERRGQIEREEDEDWGWRSAITKEGEERLTRNGIE